MPRDEDRRCIEIIAEWRSSLHRDCCEIKDHRRDKGLLPRLFQAKLNSRLYERPLYEKTLYRELHAEVVREVTTPRGAVYEDAVREKPNKRTATALQGAAS